MPKTNKEMKLIEKYLRRGMSDTEAKRRAAAEMARTSPSRKKTRKKK